MNNFFDEVLVDGVPIGTTDLDEAIARLDRLAAAMGAVSKEEEGHKFRGNQYTGGISGPGEPPRPKRSRLNGILGASRMQVVDRTKPDSPIGADSTPVSGVADSKSVSPEAAAVAAMEEGRTKKVPRVGTFASRKKKYGSTIPEVLESIRRILPNATVSGFQGVQKGTLQRLLPWEYGNNDMVWSVNSLTAVAASLDMLADRYPEQAARVTNICGDYLHSNQIAHGVYTPSEIDDILGGGLERLRNSGDPEANIKAASEISDSMLSLFQSVPHGKTYAFVATAEGRRSESGVLGPQGIEINLAGLMQREGDAELRDGNADLTDPERFSPESVAYLEDLVKSSSKFVFATVIHEFGHVMDNIASSRPQEALLEPGSDDYWENVNIMDMSVRDETLDGFSMSGPKSPFTLMQETLKGSYGSKNMAEFVAEEFAAHILGERRVSGDFSVTNSERKRRAFYPWHAEVMAYLEGTGEQPPVSKADPVQQKSRSGIVSADFFAIGDNSVATCYVESSDSEED